MVYGPEAWVVALRRGSEPRGERRDAAAWALRPRDGVVALEHG